MKTLQQIDERRREIVKTMLSPATTRTQEKDLRIELAALSWVAGTDFTVAGK